MEIVDTNSEIEIPEAINKASEVETSDVNALDTNTSEETAIKTSPVIKTEETQTDVEVNDSLTEDTVAEDSIETDPQTDAEVNDSLTEDTVAEDSIETDPQADAEVDDSLTEDTVAEDSTDTQKEEALTEETEEETIAENQEEEITEEEGETVEEESESESEEQKKESNYEQEIDRVAYEVQVQQSSTDVAIQLNEEFQTAQLIDYSGVQIYGQAPSVEAISQRLGQLWLQTGKKAAFINISLQSEQLEAFAVLPTVSDSALKKSSLVASNEINVTEDREVTIRSTVKDTSRKKLLAVAKKFRQEVSDIGKVNSSDYLESSQQLYQTLIAPIEQELQANNIEILVFSMDTGLRLLPIAALHDGEQFLIEKYALALVPSFGLTDTRYVNLSDREILAMGASHFKEQTPLPTMPIELQSVTSNPRQGKIYLNEEFTINNFKTQNSGNQPFSIIHLGTHAEFKAGNRQNSYIQFYDEKLQLSELREISDELGWNSAETTPVELLVLSACQTALGDEEAELGFAGLAVQAGVKSALASLWYVSDLGTLALMSEFYDQLSDTLIKAEALRQTQLRMLKEEVRIDKGQLQLSNGDNLDLPASFPKGNLSMSHPYFWSSFTLIGNWN